MTQMTHKWCMKYLLGNKSLNKKTESKEKHQVLSFFTLSLLAYIGTANFRIHYQTFIPGAEVKLNEDMLVITLCKIINGYIHGRYYYYIAI